MKMRARFSKAVRLLFVMICFIIFTSLLMQTRLEEYRIRNVLYGDRLSHKEERKLQFEKQNLEYLRYQKMEPNMTGPGEGGMKVELTEGERTLVDEQLQKEGFSEYLSNKVSLERSLPDYRPELCKNQHYPSDLPTASVILIFSNELQSVILRTVHSIVNRTPPRYLQEVILVDDASTRAQLMAPLQEYIEQHWPPNLVHLIRLPVRSGLIRARLAGVHAAKGDVVIMMDAHSEVTQGWIEPLLARTKQNNRTLVASVVDIIDASTMAYVEEGSFYQTFLWNMLYQWVNLPAGHNPLDPVPSYALVGCMMAMNRLIFLEMGSYDTGMLFWGGENVELPIRIWMCGGRVEIIPCSKMAHMYRAKSSKPWNATDLDGVIDRNTQRIAEVWLDEYKEEFYAIRPHLKDLAPAIRANVTDRIALRKRLKCKSFHWFVTNIVKPPVFSYIKNNTAWGKLHNVALDQCLDSLNAKNEGPFGVYPCVNSVNQVFTLKWSGQLRKQVECASYNDITPGGKGQLSHSCKDDSSQRWRYDEAKQTMIHERSNLCLDTARETDPFIYVILNKCDDSVTQRWTWEHYTGPEIA